MDIFLQHLLRQMEEVGQKYQIATAQLKICCCSWMTLDCKSSLCDCVPVLIFGASFIFSRPGRFF